MKKVNKNKAIKAIKAIYGVSKEEALELVPMFVRKAA